MTVSSSVSLILTGQDAGASAAVDAVAGSAGGLGAMLGPAGIVAAGGAAAVGVMVAVGSAAFGMSQDMDTAMNLFQARTNTGEAGMAAFEDAAEGVFNNNWGESLGDVGAAMTLVNTVMGAGSDEIGGLTEQALILRDVFEQDIASSTRAADTAMENFGTSGAEIFDLMTAAIQETGDPADDLLDTINEYSADFAEAGFSAQDMFNLLIAGSDAGIFNMDKTADAVREFNTRLIDGSASSLEAFDTLGTGSAVLWEMFERGVISYDEYNARIASNEPLDHMSVLSEAMQSGMFDGADAMQLVIEQLEDLEDPIARDAAGVALFGSLWEDLGADAILALNDVEDSLGSVEGRTAAAGDIVSQGLGPAWETFKRNVGTSLIPLGDMIGEGLALATPHLITLAAWLGENLPIAVDFLRAKIDEWWPVVVGVIGQIRAFWDRDGSAIVSKAAEVWGLFYGWFESNIARFTALWDGVVALFEGDFEAFGAAIGTFVQITVQRIIDLVSGLWDLVSPWLATLWAGLVEWFTTTDFPALGLQIINAIGDAVAGFWGVIQPWLLDMWTNLQAWFSEQDFAGQGQGMIDRITAAVSTWWANDVLPWLSGVFTSIQLWFTETDWQQLGFTVTTEILTALHGLWVDVSTWLGETYTNFVTWFTETDWEALALELLTRVTTQLATFWEVNLLPWLSGLLTSISTWFIETDWSALATNIISGIVTGLQSGGQQIIDALVGLAQGAIAAWMAFWEEQSPSRRMFRSGANIALGIPPGIESEIPAVDAAMVRLQNAISGPPLTVGPIGGPGAVGGGFGGPGVIPGGGPGGRPVTIGTINIYDSAAAETLIAYLESKVSEAALAGI